MMRRGLGLVSALTLVLGVVSYANAGAAGAADVTLEASMANPVAPGAALSFDIFATMTEVPSDGQVVALRGMQLDYSNTSGEIGLPAEMDFSNPGGIYAEFEDLPVPASVWPLPNADLIQFMVVLDLGVPILLGTVDVTAQESESIRTLDIANAGEANINFGGSLKFGFGVEPGDPITDWRFNTGELSGGTYDIVTPEPATLALVVFGAIAGLRRRRSA